MQEPKAKGSLVLGVVILCKRHRNQGRVSPEQLERKLCPEAIPLIDERINISAWYPMQAFADLVNLEWEVGGNFEPSYMRKMGEASANRLFDMGIYRQLDYAQRHGRGAPTRQQLISNLRTVNTVVHSLYNFIEASVRLDQPDRLQVVYDNASPFTEALRLTTEGFMTCVSRRQGSTRTWTSTWETPERLVFSVPVREREE